MTTLGFTRLRCYPLGKRDRYDRSHLRRDDCALVLSRARNGESSEIGLPIRRYGHRLAPVVLIGLGVLILYQAGSFGLLLR